jgi:predicted  nucleic acid-binding Zn-ribbon protein
MELVLPQLEHLHQLYLRIDALKKELSALPRHVAEIEKKLEGQKRELAAQKTALEENEKEHRRIDGEILLAKQKLERLQAQMSEAKTNDQYRAFRNEIHFATTEIRKGEDRVLDKMEEAEGLREKIKAAEESLAQEQISVAKEVEEMRGRFKGDEDALATALEDRKAAIRDVPASALRSYERAHRKLGVRAMAPIKGAVCSSCHMVIRPQLLQQLRQLGQITSCEFCGAILYDPAVLEPEAEDPAGEAGIG